MSLEQNTFLGCYEMLSPNAAHFYLLLSPTAHHSFPKKHHKNTNILVISLHSHDVIIFNKCFHNKHPLLRTAGCHLCNYNCKI